MDKTGRDELNTKLFKVLDSHEEIHPKMTPFDRAKMKAIIFQGRTTGRDIKHANLYYEGTEGWTNVHYYRKHFITTPKYLCKARALASSRRLAEVVKVVPGFNEEVAVTHEGGAIETEPTTRDEIMEMEITMAMASQTHRVDVRPSGGGEAVAPGAAASASDSSALVTAADAAAVGNLVEDDEWLGLAMEMAILVRVAVREEAKKQIRGFTSKDDYKIGDLSKEIDARVKAEVARLRDKDEYELGDLSVALDQLTKEQVCKLTGKSEYAAGDLSVEIDGRVKSAVAAFCGKEEYTTGDLTREIDRRAKSAVADFTGKEQYTFGDISRELESRRAAWVQEFTGKSDYQFGDLTKTFVSNFTGKGEYQFGDITKRVGQMLFGNKQVKKEKQ
ncbi:hypothetical protein EMIHUDRAFT_120154 [Emiliania huxleyi CCMP1516]|uniref:Uncharacterized protein n=2 Tax=Emiliania huxleyi TaxID=2903 RepID=A0A0D3ILY1_EMIH1|nr:hypothetical protein EMIHUDRAFT_120154 [Emiliania huxleyi CCMP1516]EOD12266.1 hypothetical protein EMIHUDRAFT_120154 [Emiliania huxleyi CCMP1516]|eukprot:XP_005764695.1 hypothetical protein EMIHUDRAFT_120154 [Emiliania huxleyi CCMP1516]